MNSYILIITSIDKVPIHLNGELFIDENAPLWQDQHENIFCVGCAGDCDNKWFSILSNNNNNEYILLGDDFIIPDLKSFIAWKQIIIDNDTSIFQKILDIGIQPVPDDV